MPRKCSVLESKNYNFVVPVSGNKLFLNNKPTLVLNKETLHLPDGIVEDIQFWRDTVHYNSYVDIRGYIKTCISDNSFFSFSYKISLDYLQEELSKHLIKLVEDIAELDVIKLRLLSDMITMYVKRQQVKNLNKLLTIFDIDEYYDFSVKSDINTLDFKKLNFRVEYCIRTNKYKFYENPNAENKYNSYYCRYNERNNLCYFNGMDFLVLRRYDQSYKNINDSLGDSLKLMSYIIYKFGGAAKYNKFISEFEKQLITTS